MPSWIMPPPGSAEPDETAIIERWFRRPSQRADVLLGIGDDAALTGVPAGCELVTAVDTLVEGTHFYPGTDPQALGHRSLAVNLSDLAAMGADPAWFLLSLSLPQATASWLDAFAEGLFSLAGQHGLALIGGDTVRGPLAISITVCGFVPAGQGIRRSGAQPGDGIWVSGHPGDAVAGRLLLATDAGPEGPDQQYLANRFLRPQPRLAGGRALRGLATAMIDLSDGLHTDLGRLLAASGVGALLDIEKLPLSASLKAVAAASAVSHALYGGDDYELCCTLPAGLSPPDLSGCPFTHIGSVVPGQGVHWRLQGRPWSGADTSFRHF